MRFQCPHCQTIVSIDDSECGHPVGCGNCGGVANVPDSRFSPGAVINDFVIRQVIGHGGMGQVYLAHQISLDRPVALKVLMEQFSSDREFILDFVKEARAAARLNHPNIVQSYAVGEEDGIYFFAMEYVEGETLTQLLQREKRLSIERGINIVQQIAEALDFAWKHQQLVHRDVKPDNIMMTARGVAKLADLGLARAAGELLEDLQEDEVMGTPQYICPEQLLGQPMDTRGDIYSLGATFYQMVTGKFPYEGKSPAEIARKHLQDPLLPPHEASDAVPEAVSWVIQKMMAKKAEDRYPDAAPLVVDLNLILRGEPPVGFTGKMTGKPLPKVPSPVDDEEDDDLDPDEDDADSLDLDPDEDDDDDEDGDVAEMTIGGTLHRTKRSGSKPKLKLGGKKSRTKTKLTLGSKDDDAGDGGTRTLNTATRLKTGSAAAARKDGAKPKKSKGVLIGLSIGGAVIVLAALALVILAIVWVSTYSPATAEEAEALYFRNPANADEKEQYEAIKPFIGQVDEYKDDLQSLNNAVNRCNAFVGKYPGSLFSRSGSDLDYADLFDAPGIFGNKIAKAARPLAGIVPETLALYEEQLIRTMRGQQHEQELETVATRREEAARQDEWGKIVGQLRDYAKKRQAELNRDRNRLSGNLKAKENVLAREKEEIRKSILTSIALERDFREAINLLRRKSIDRTGYPNTVAGEIRSIAQTDELEQARRFLRGIDRANEDVTLRRLEDEMRGQLNELKVNEIKEEVGGFAEREDSIYQLREHWFSTMLEATEQAKRYFELVSGTLNKLEDRKVKANVKIKDGQQLRVEMISTDTIVLRIVELDFRTNKYETRDTAKLQLTQLPFDQFVELARASWGESNLDEYDLMLGCYAAMVGNLGLAKTQFEKTGGPLASFLQAELEAFEPVFRELRMVQLVARLKEWVDTGKTDAARAYYEQVIKKNLGETPEFQARDAEMRRILGLDE